MVECGLPIGDNKVSLVPVAESEFCHSCAGVTHYSQQIFDLRKGFTDMAQHDYIPRSDTEFAAWAHNFMDYVTGHSAELGITMDLTPLTTARTDFTAALTEHNSAKQTAKAARQTKVERRKEFEAAIRKITQQLQASGAVDDTERAALGITVPDTIRTPATEEIRTRPIGIVDTSQRLQHTICFSDESTPTKRAKPAGVLGCEIWVKLTAPGEQPRTGTDELRFVDLATASPYVVEYNGGDGGKTAHYMLRWIRRNGIKGPWSETLSATITH
jgi:hypothetical protein